MYIINPFKILVSTSNYKAVRDIRHVLPDDRYDVVPAFSVDITLKTVFNTKISAIILDVEQNMNIGNGNVFNILCEINETRRIPIIMMTKDGKSFSFNNYGVEKENYDIACLEQNLSIMLGDGKDNYDENETIKSLVNSLVVALDMKDSYSRNHSARVSRFSAFLAEKMGLSKDKVSIAKTAGLFHDLGKIGIPDRILTKPDHLTNEEFAIIKEHPVQSEVICSPVPAFKNLLLIMRGHHERLDGGGYPDGLKGERIPVEARVIAVADAFDALTSNRAYRHAFDLNKVKDIMNDGAGTQWDPDIVKCFLENFSVDGFTQMLKVQSAGVYAKRENLLDGTIFGVLPSG